MSGFNIRPVAPGDAYALWRILEPVIREGETMALPRDWSREETLAHWCAPDNTVFVAEDNGKVLGTYYSKANKMGGGDHVANGGYATDPAARGRSLARAMGAHSIAFAKEQGFKAIQFNFVVSTNTVAVALWKSLGFDVVGTLPGAFNHPRLGYVDALVMYQRL